jgi:hypothetical protein
MEIMSQGLNYLDGVIYYNKKCIRHAGLELQTRLFIAYSQASLL